MMKLFNQTGNHIVLGFSIALIIAQSCVEPEAKVNLPEEIRPKNIILMIGDGMGLAQIQAARMVSGKALHMEKASTIGLMKTHSFDDQITDSGAAGTAMATGKKTRNGMIGMSQDSLPQPSLLDIFASQGKTTGIVVSCAVTHATPAAFIAKNVSRSHYEEIAADFMKSPVNVVIGGGRNHFDNRTDGQLLTEQLKINGYQVFNSFIDITGNPSKFYLLTDSVHPKTMLEGRGNLLSAGTKLALESLSTNPGGFFLMVEGSQIDWGGHENDSAYVVSETIDFDDAVGLAIDFAERTPGTLVIITADHETGGLSLVGNESGSNKYISLSFASGDHTPIMVPVMAFGNYAAYFAGIYDNTELFQRIIDVAGQSN